MNNQTLAIALLIVFVLYAFGVVGKSNDSLRLIGKFLKGMYFVLSGIVRGLSWLFTGNHKTKEIYGKAKFLESSDRSKLVNKNNDGLIIEGDKRITSSLSFQQLALVANTGYGKTTKFVIPQLLQMTTVDRSFVVTDPTGEIFQNTSGYLKSIGYKVERIDFSNPHDSSFGYNPLSKALSHSDIERVADVLVRSASPDRTGNNSFWNDFATTILSCHMKCLKSDRVDPKFQSLANLRFLLNRFGRNGQALMDFYLKTADAITYNELLGILGNDEKLLLSGLQTAKTTLKLFSNPDTCLATSRSPQHDFQALRDVPTILYVGLAENEQERFKPLISMFYAELFSSCMEMPREGDIYLPIYILLEEAGNLFVPGLASYVSTLRKRRTSISIIVQSEKQLSKNYGRDDADTILSNCGTKVYFPGLDIDTCKKLELTLGQETIEFTEPTRNPFGGGESKRPIRVVGKPLMFSEEIRRMEHPLMLAVNHRPIILQSMNPFYEDPVQIKRSKMPPVVFPPLENDQVEFIDLNSFSNLPENENDHVK
jgi:type IV secretory pathway TraG/TraD family ATPase VirD4